MMTLREFIREKELAPWTEERPEEYWSADMDCEVRKLGMREVLGGTEDVYLITDEEKRARAILLDNNAESELINEDHPEWIPLLFIGQPLIYCYNISPNSWHEDGSVADYNRAPEGVLETNEDGEPLGSFDEVIEAWQAQGYECRRLEGSGCFGCSGGEAQLIECGEGDEAFVRLLEISL